MLNFLFVMKIFGSEVITDYVSDINTIMGSIVKKTSHNERFVLIIEVDSTQYIYLDLDKILKNYDFHEITIKEFITNHLSDEIIEGNVYTDDLPLMGKTISTFFLGDILKPTVVTKFTNATTGKDSMSMDDLATPDFKVSIPNIDHRYIIPVFDNRLYFNQSVSSSSVILKEIKPIIHEKFNNIFPIERLSFIDLSNAGYPPKSVRISNLSPVIQSDKGMIIFDYTNVNNIGFSVKDVIIVLDGYIVPKRFIEIDTTSKKIRIKSNILKHNDVWNDVESLELLNSTNSFAVLLPCKYYYDRYSVIRDIKSHGYIYTTQELTNGTLLGINTDTSEFINVVILQSKYTDRSRQYIYRETYIGRNGATEEREKYTNQIVKYHLHFQIRDEFAKDEILAPLYESENIYNSHITVNKDIPVSVFKITFGR